MYEAIADPYCYPGTNILINKLGLCDQVALDDFETEITAQRSAEGLPAGEFDAVHYCAIHHHLFQDVFAWAGKFRTVRIAKNGSMFCYPEHIDCEIIKLFATHQFDGLRTETFVEMASRFLSDLNAIHPFREGNGRAQLTWLTDRRTRRASRVIRPHGPPRDARRDDREFQR